MLMRLLVIMSDRAFRMEVVDQLELSMEVIQVVDQLELLMVVTQVVDR